MTIQKKEKILIIGAGEAGRIILAEYTRQKRQKNIIGFIDDDQVKIGNTIDTIPVLAGRSQLKEIMLREEVTSVIIALPSIHIHVIQEIISLIVATDPAILIQVLPKVTRHFSANLLHQLEDISCNDLLAREEYDIDMPAIEETYHQKTILITGAGGSIGSELCKQLLHFNIKRIICVGRGENSIYQLARKLEETFSLIHTEFIYKICDIKDIHLLESICTYYKPDIIFHAAAHKHVPLLECNEIEALQNNVRGTYNVLQCGQKIAVEKFVLISSDKAVNPVNIMGATKRIAEIITDFFHRKYALRTAVVRFGNVLGSRGSVIPLFKDQIARGGPVTVTHPEVKRFFMSIPEAALLVINAASYAQGGETFVLNMGEQYKIVDIALRLIRLHGLEPGKDIQIDYTGLRPGEKLFEELYYDAQHVVQTRNNNIYIMKDTHHTLSDETLLAFMNTDFKNLITSSPEKIRSRIKSIVPEYDYSAYHDAEDAYRRLVH